MRAGVAASAMAALLVLAGCRQDMHNQPKFVPQRGTTFFADGRSARPQVENTVARNQMDEDAYFYTGIVDGKEGDGLPIPLNAATLERGQERYNIYCTPCHSRVGNGDGMIVQRGYRPAGNFHTDRLRNAPLGHFFAVMTNGYGAMPDYSAQLTPEDRWAVAAYIRALQLSQDAKPSDVAGRARMLKICTRLRRILACRTGLRIHGDCRRRRSTERRTTKTTGFPDSRWGHLQRERARTMDRARRRTQASGTRAVNRPLR
jgi:hypothetical protein